MWFAALGTIQHNPWLVSFTNKLLQGCPTVIDLLDEPEIAAGKAKIRRVRANLYHYDFTRLDSKWARQIPGTKILGTNSLFNLFPDQVWTRNLIRQYLPPLESDNTSLLEFLQHAGYGSSICLDNADRCVSVGPGAQIPCHLASYIRKWNTNFRVLPLVSFLLSCIFQCFEFRRRKQPKKSKLD